MAGFDLPNCQLGVATAATQIEGGDLDTNWHRWAASGRIVDGSSPARAADHWNRVDEDIALLVELGITHYRMGLEWARVEPNPGEFDTAAIGHYRDEVAALRAAGITPLVTLHHFNLPGWLVDEGGWLGAGMKPAFGRFARRMVTELSPWVNEWIPINEPNVYATLGFSEGVWPPGERSLLRTIKAVQVQVEVHIATYQMIHALQPQARVGTAHHLRVFAPANPSNPLHRLASRATDWMFQRTMVKAMSTGVFDLPLRRPSGVVPGRYYDFQGVNYYTRSSVKGLADGMATGVPVNDLGWEIYPAGLTEVCRWIHQTYPGPIYITENGTADAEDSFRARYLYDHLQEVAGNGLPIERYYHWCFTDNWEWADGEAPRFGLIELDYETQQRTVKESGRFYADIIAHGGVTAEAHQRWVAGQHYRRSSEVSNG
ncbi:MAG: glycoside hydrolase family 1 protein [Actinobacteria bacterium HGW-Actinobacteria-2]|nr:MAG: glycoside hydrolase family 1 protein [Actinobacteria bacterium HGW-Actinobacteria-2]